MSNSLAPEFDEIPHEEQIAATVLVIDDEANIVTLLETWLETIGCTVVSANDGASGVAKAKELCPDLILMDGMMPNMSGFDACKILKSEESTSDIPIIFLTVQGEVRDVVKGLELGAHGYMTKPFKPQELLARVRSTLKIKQIQDRLKSHTQRLRLQWNWMHGVIESLPMGLMVFDPETDKIIYANDRFTEMLNLSEPSVETRRMQFLKDGQPVAAVWSAKETVDESLYLTLDSKSLGEFRVRAIPFEKNGRLGKQVLIEPV